MAKDADRLSEMVLRQMAQLLRREYRGRLVPRFIRAASLRTKMRPGKTADQVFNAMGHFSDAIIASLKFDSTSESKQDPQKRRQKRLRVQAGIDLNLARAKKHFVAAQFYSLHYAVGVRDQDVARLLNWPQAKDNDEFDDARDKIRGWRESWKFMLEPQNDKTKNIEETLAEIERLNADILTLIRVLTDLEELLADVKPRVERLINVG